MFMSDGPLIPEFDVWQDLTGWHGRHCVTQQTIDASTFTELADTAMAVRIARSIKGTT